MEWYAPHPPSYYIVFAAGLVALLLLARWFATAPTARSVPLLGLRIAILALLFVILLEPVRVTETRLPDRPPSAVYLVDRSRSMALEQPVSRLDHARRTMAIAEGKLPVDSRPKIQYYGFGADVEAVDHVGQLKADSTETRLSKVLEELVWRLVANLPNSVILFSDGRSTEPSELGPITQAYQRLGVPIHVVPLGSSRAAGDVAIQSVVAPRETRSATKVPVRVVVRSRGFAGERAELKIRSLEIRANPSLASLPLTLADGEISRELVIDSDKIEGPLVVEVPPRPGEAIFDNNRVPFQLIRRNPKIRVIYMEGTVGEYPWVRDALTEDPNIECLAMEIENQSTVNHRLHRIEDPARGYPTTREELFGYDVVICSDVNRGAFTPQQLEWTVELVNKRGGGFAMVGGITSFGAGRWDETIWDGMIPIDMTGTATGGDGTLRDFSFKVQVPPEAEGHPIWHIVDDSAKNREVLGRMPLFHGTNLTDRLKPAAMVLGVAPIRLPGYLARQRGMQPRQPRRPVSLATGGAPPQPAAGESLLPAFSCQSYGKGRTFAFSSDTTYGWGTDFEKFWGEGDNRYFRKFWRNVVTWLAENSANANRRLTVETDKVLYHPGEPVRISANALDEHLEPTHAYRLVASFQGIAGQPGSSPLLQRSQTMIPGAGTGTYQAELPIPSLSQWAALNPDGAEKVRELTLRIVSYDGNQIVTESHLGVQVIDDFPEYRDTRPDRASLELIAQKSGGRVLTGPDDLAELLRGYHAIPGEVIVSRSPLWDTPILMLALIGLLTTEWVMRRAKGLA
jgi:hypothetical protein